MTSVGTPEIGRRLAAARLQRGLSQCTVARLAGLAPSYISRIENGRVQPTFRTVLKIAGGLRIAPEEIVDPPPDPRTRSRRSCPVSHNGRCMLDLLRSETQIEREHDRDAYSPRQIRLMKQLAAWVRDAPNDRLRAMEILIDDLSRGSRGKSRSD